jgi:hypothetical protein
MSAANFGTPASYQRARGDATFLDEPGAVPPALGGSALDERSE